MKTATTALFAILLTGAAALAAGPSLKGAYRGDFVVGAAINTAEITGKDTRSDAIVKNQFNSISPENVLKWEKVHPTPNRYDFALPDKYVAFGRKHHMYIVGHVLLWHNQTPDWVFHDDKGNLLDRAALLKRLKSHIYTVVRRYKGKIKAWDVVNEAVDEDGSMRQSLWYKIIGDSYVAKAFRYAHEADPKAELIYNDFNLENDVKRAGAVALIKKLKAEGVPVNTVGLQGHYIMDWPTPEQLDAAISDFEKLGVKVAITELDIDVLPRKSDKSTADINYRMEDDPAMNPYVNGLPNAVQQQLAKRYADFFAVCLEHKKAVDRVTVWGVTDADTWHNNWPIKGRTAYSLLFDRSGQPKPAVDAVIEAAKPGR